MTAREDLERMVREVRAGRKEPFDARWHEQTVAATARRAAVLILFGGLDGGSLPTDAGHGSMNSFNTSQ